MSSCSVEYKTDNLALCDYMQLVQVIFLWSMINIALKSYFNQTITYIYNNYKLVLIQSITEAYYIYKD
jgi:hypothetical protein